MKSFYKCALFDREVKDLSSFDFDQDEIVFSKFEANNKAKFSKLSVKYNVKFHESEALDVNKIPLLMPTKDLSELLKFTLDKLFSLKVVDHCNVFVIDDRSSENIKDICDSYDGISYIRVDNNKGFNFGNLINIGAFICHKLGFKQIISWNNDLWPNSESDVPELIKRHDESGCTISGTKLLYPTESWNGEETSKNISFHFPNMSDTYRGTVQFGGSIFVPYANTMTTHHLKRFASHDHSMVNVDSATFFVTGAYHLIELQWLITSGGFNPSLSKIFNDADLCLRAVEDNKLIMYFGKDIYLFHDESVTNLNEIKIDRQYNSDSILYPKIWDMNRISKLL